MTTTIDLSSLPAPEIIEQLDFEVILAEARADLLARFPDAADVIDLESEPLIALLQAGAYRELVVRAAANDQAKGSMLAFASGATLEQLAALVGVRRLVIDPGDPDAVPPRPSVLEPDRDLRDRAQIAPEAFTVAGTEDEYIARAREADGRVRDVSVVSAVSPELDVYVLGRDGDGTPAADVIAAVDLHLQRWRVLTDVVRVHPAGIVPYSVQAELILYPGPAAGLVLAAATASIRAYRDKQHGMGRDITRSALFAALHVAGVQRVELTSPDADIDVTAAAAAWCPDGDIQITVAEVRHV